MNSMENYRNCPICRNNVEYVPEYNDYYCWTCKKYLGNMVPPPPEVSHNYQSQQEPRTSFNDIATMDYPSTTNQGISTDGIPDFPSTKNGILVIVVGLIIQLIGPIATITSPTISLVISLAGTALILVGMFMIYFAIKRGEINIQKTTERVNLSMVLIVVGLLMFAASFLFLPTAENDLNKAEDADNRGDYDEAGEHFKDAAGKLAIGTILSSIGRLISFIAPVLTMLGISAVCFDEYQGKITMRALFSTVFMIIAIVAMIIGILLIVSSINSISNDPTASEITDIGESVIGAVASICLAVIIFIIAYILIILTATATYAGLRQVEGVHKRRMAGW